ncbi:hypothetical protein [Kurthia senegalensis]|uniref:hypothetical protein n=1 Tax=Kurthia senegalensis TaxID=1033740 RepID=UPI00028A2435|nr:hypothetical protein [Kurthia senegalensis]
MPFTDEEISVLIAINGERATEKRLEQYKALATVYYDFAVEYCNNKNITFRQTQIFLAKAIQFYLNKSGLTARSMGTVSYSYTTDLPTSVLYPLKPFKKLRW